MLKEFKKICLRLAIFPIIFTLCSCGHGNQASENQEIRIVDVNGNPKPVKRYVPELNAQILAQQNTTPNYPQPSTNPEQTSPNLAADNSSIAPNQGQILETGPIVNTLPAETNIANADKAADTIEYDLSSGNAAPLDASNDEKAKGKKFKIASIGKSESRTSIKNSTSKGTFIQIGSFLVADNAKKALASVKKISKGEIVEVGEDKKFYKVLLGPIKNKKTTTSILRKVVKSGYRDAFIVKNH